MNVNLESIIALMDRISDREMKNRAMRSVCKRLALNGFMDDAGRICDEGTLYIVVHSDEYLENLARRYLKGGEIDKVMEAMEKTGVVGTVNIAKMLASKGKYQDVLEFLDEKYDPVIRLWILFEVLKYPVERGEYDIVSKLVERMEKDIEIVEKDSEIEPSEKWEAYYYFAWGLKAIGNDDKALEYFEKSKNEVNSIDAIRSEIVGIEYHAGNREEAYELISKDLQASERENKEICASFPYPLLEIMVQRDPWIEEKIKKEVCLYIRYFRYLISNNLEDVPSHSEVSVLRKSTGDRDKLIKELIQLLLEIEINEKIAKSCDLDMVIKMFVKNSYFDVAREIMKRVESAFLSKQKVSLEDYILLGNYSISLRDAERAEKYIEKAYELWKEREEKRYARKIGGAFIDTAKLYNEMKRFDEATLLLEKVNDIVERISDAFTKNVLLKDSAPVLADIWIARHGDTNDVHPEDTV